MNVTKLHTIPSIADGEYIECIRGDVKEIGKVVKDTRKGEWTFQPVVLVGADGFEVTAKFWDRDPIDPKMVGMHCIVTTCQEGSARGRSIKVKEETYRNETSKKIQVNKSATVEFVKTTDIQRPAATPAPASSSAPAEPAPQNQAQRAPAPARPPQPPKETTQMQDCVNAAVRCANMQTLAQIAGRNACERIKAAGVTMTSDQENSLISGIAIRMGYDGIHHQCPAMPFGAEQITQLKDGLASL